MRDIKIKIKQSLSVGEKEKKEQHCKAQGAYIDRATCTGRICIMNLSENRKERREALTFSEYM